MYFYEILEQVLCEKGMTIPQAARACGLSDGTIRSMIVRKNKSVTIEVAFRLSDGLGVSLERLNGMDEPDTKKAPPSEDEDADDIKTQLIENYDSMNDAGRQELLKHSQLLLKDDQYHACAQFEVDTGIA